MFFSIIVPIYNVELYLDECLNSIKSQIFDDFEVLMIDDGSTDSCAKICKKYVDLDNRFIYIHKKNEGVVSARKKGAEIAKGIYVVSIDGDDYVENTFLERLHHICKDGYDMVAFGYTTIDGKRNEIIKNKIDIGEYVGRDVDTIKDSFMYDKRIKGINTGSLIFSIWSKAVKKDLYRIYQQRVDNRISKGDDLAVLAGIVYHCKSIYISDICDYNYRIRSNSITRDLKNKDFIKQSILRDFLLVNVDDVYTNQVRVFLLYTTLSLLAVNINNVNTYREYMGIVKLIDDYNLFKEAVESKIEKPFFRNKILIGLIKNKFWNLMYLYYKYLNKK